MNGLSGTALVVDDSRTKRYVIGSWLRRAGLDVVEADTGTAALAALDREPADVVILDVELPDMNGYDVCERIKSHPTHSAIPVVQVSAHAVNVADRTQGLNRGADAYLAEPIEPEELLATVHAVLRYYRARQRAERLATRLAVLAETTLEINRADGYDALLSATARGAARIFGAVAEASATRPDGTRRVFTAAADGVATAVSSWSGASPQLVAVGVGATILVEPARRWPGRLPLPPDAPVSVAAVRARESRPPCYVAVGVGDLDADDANVLRQLGQAMTLAVEAMRVHDEERYVALTVQRSLLPRQLPDVPGYDACVRYVPAGSHAEIGGDFYELAMVDGQLVVAIGDVVGHSLHAATVMAELRHALRAYVSEGHGPAAVLRQLNTMMVKLLPDEIATVSLLMIEPATGRVRAASGGHLPPLLVLDGEAEPVRLVGPLLGVEIERPDDAEFTLPAGGVLIMLTDGLVERHDQPFEDGLAMVLAAARGIEPDLEEFCDRLLVELDSVTSEDDIALVVVRRHA